MTTAIAIALLVCSRPGAVFAASAPSAGTAKPAAAGGERSSPFAKTADGFGAGGEVQLGLKLPKPVFVGTPKNAPPGTTVEKPTGKKRPPVMVPAGTVNAAKGRPVTSSARDPLVGELSLITDGDKEATDGSYVELSRGKHWVQIDLGRNFELSVILVWHYHGDPRVYHDVVVQAALDKDFITGVRTVFNNDHDSSLGLGVGKDKEYYETYEGRLIEARAAKARYVRFYSRGSTADEMNRYTEAEVYGRPVN